jgi:hypothetical protein
MDIIKRCRRTNCLTHPVRESISFCRGQALRNPISASAGLNA